MFYLICDITIIDTRIIIDISRDNRYMIILIYIIFAVCELTRKYSNILTR